MFLTCFDTLARLQPVSPLVPTSRPPLSPPGSLMDVLCTLSSCSSSWSSAPSGLRRDHRSLPATLLIPTLFATSIIIIRISLGRQVLSLEGGLLTHHLVTFPKPCLCFFLVIFHVFWFILWLISSPFQTSSLRAMCIFPPVLFCPTLIEFTCIQFPFQFSIYMRVVP